MKKFSLVLCSASVVLMLAGCKPNGSKAIVTFKNYDGTILDQHEMLTGESAEYKGQVPYKPATGDEKWNYFIGWDKTLNEVKGDTIFQAQYKRMDNIVDKDNDGIPEGIDTNDNPNDENCNKFDVTAKSFVNIKQNIKIDFSDFLAPDANTTYNNNIAKLGLFLSNPNIEFKDGLFNPKAYGGLENAMYARLGCDKWKHFDFKDEAVKSYKYDVRDTTSGCVAHKYLYNSDGTLAKDLIIIAFEGTNGKNRWASNFDVGYDDPMYYQKAANTERGEEGTKDDHPEWDDNGKDFHKGFYIAAHRVLNDTIPGKDGTNIEGPVKLLKYIEENTTEGLDLPIVFVTGHSRGGAMANIIGEYLQNKYVDENNASKCIPFTYAFAAPSVYGKTESVPTANTLFNILNDDDLVTKVPFGEWGFTKITGRDTIIKSAGNYKEKYDDGNTRKYQWIPGETTESIFHNLGCEGRAEIYNIDTTDNCKYISKFPLNEVTCTTEDQANAELVRLKSEYSDKLGDFFKFVEFKIHDDTLLTTQYNIYAHSCLGTITALVGCLMTNDEKVLSNLDYVIPLISNDKFLELAGSLITQLVDIEKDPTSEIGIKIKVNTDKIALPHDYGAYHIILRELQ